MEGRSYPVDVISVCSADGEITPLRLRVRSGGCSFVKINIDQIVSRKKINYVGAESHIFLCRATLEDHPWMFELHYAVRTHNWSLGRRVY